MTERTAVKPLHGTQTSRAPVLAARASGVAMLPADRSFKVLQHSRTPAQLSLFPPPGLAARNGR